MKKQIELVVAAELLREPPGVRQVQISRRKIAWLLVSGPRSGPSATHGALRDLEHHAEEEVVDRGGERSMDRITIR